MNNYYIINGEVEFNPATSSLKPLNDPDNIIELNSPAARCFLLLISKQGEIIGQQEFMAEVWEKNGIYVTPNTYYQNISILRKGLKKAGLEDDIIVTVPRMGLTLISEIPIVSKPACSTAMLARENDGTIAEAQPADDSAAEDCATAENPNALKMQASDIKQTAPEGSLLHAFYTPPFMPSWFISAATLNKLTAPWRLGLVLLLAGVLIYLLSGNDQHRFRYRLIYQAQGCKIYAGHYRDNKEFKREAVKWGMAFAGECKTYPYIYVDFYKILPQLSVIRCTKSFDDDNECLSSSFTRTAKGLQDEK